MTGPLTDREALVRQIARDAEAVNELGLTPRVPDAQARVIADCAQRYLAAQVFGGDVEMHAWGNLVDALEGWRTSAQRGGAPLPSRTPMSGPGATNVAPSTMTDRSLVCIAILGLAIGAMVSVAMLVAGVWKLAGGGS